MTAEIALLNKVAVALAADSAATISAGDQDEKVYNSEDKLFQLSSTQPIGIMIYNAPHFMETPVQILIKRYRAFNRRFFTIDEAADDFKSYLNDFGCSLDENVKSRCVQMLTREPAKLVADRVSSEINKVQKKGGKIDADLILEEALDFYLDIFQTAGKCRFVNQSANRLVKSIASGLAKENQKISDPTERKTKEKFDQVMETFLTSAYPSRKVMGIVIAGYADQEIFPSLRSFQVDGMIANSIRIIDPKETDIVFDGPKAKVVPYAQQEMVDRFVCGIDKSSQRFVETICKDLLEDYRSELLNIFDLDDADQKDLEKRLVKAEDVFLQRFKEEAFDELKDSLTVDIESMIEFMPKPELAQMAEALVELTSIKRRVSKGFDTVGGPIDVAVISKSEGFVWIKRKHYFDPEKNSRYFSGMNGRISEGANEHGTTRQTLGPRPRKRATSQRRQERKKQGAKQSQPKGV